MPSWRKFRKLAYQGGLYEAQDVFAEVDDVDLICPTPGRGFQYREPLQKWMMWRDVSRKLASVNPGLQPVKLDRDYDVFVAVPRLDAQDAGTVQKLYDARDLDFRLRPGSAAVDRGTKLAGVTDDFAGRAPDLGALELGAPLPVYGPRP